MPALTLANLGIYAAQVLVIVAAAGLVLVALRPGPRARLAVLRLVFLLIVLLPLQPSLSRVDSDPAPGHTATVAIGTEALDVTAGGRAWPWRPWLAAILGGGIIVRAVWLLLGLAMLTRLTRGALPVVEHPVVQDVQGSLGVRARVAWHDAVPQAVTFGLWPAVVLLPSALRQAPEGQLRSILCHELLHVQRRDWALVLVEEGVRTVLWWHPAIWWLVDELQLAREQVIDRRTVETLGGRRDYLDALLGTAAAPVTIPLLSAFLRRRQLARRIASLAQEVSMSRTRLVVTTTAAILAVTISSVLVVQALPLAPEPQAFSDSGPQAAGGPAQRPGPRVVQRVDVHFPLAGANAELAQVTVTVRATVDATGQVTSATLGAWSMRSTTGASAQFTGVPLEESLRALAPIGQTAPSGDGIHALLESVRAMVDASVDAVGQWSLEPPITAPGTVDVVVRFDPRQSTAVAGPVAAVSGYGPADIATAAPAQPTRAQRVVLSAEARPALRVGGAIKPPKKLSHEAPVYPEDAKAAGVQGVVILEVTIDETGVPSDARVLRSVPQLDQAAIDAVMQWRYEPTLLNGAPTSVIMTVTMNFTLEA